MKKYKSGINYGLNTVSPEKIESLLNQKSYSRNGYEDEHENNIDSKKMYKDEDYDNENDGIEEWNYNDKYDPDLLWSWME